MKYGSLFTGIGGIDQGLDRAGMECVWQIEIKPDCHTELEKHWPRVRKYYDVRKFEQYGLDPIDLLAGGFPCQPHSVAGERRGAEDERNLWPDYLRIIKTFKPRWVLPENVIGIRTTMADTVLADLEAAGYTCWPLVVGACAVGAPHRRNRVWFVAYRDGDRQFKPQRLFGEQRRRSQDCRCGMDDAASARTGTRAEILQAGQPEPGGASRMADAVCPERRPCACEAHGDHWTDGRREETGRSEFRGELLADSTEQRWKEERAESQGWTGRLEDLQRGSGVGDANGRVYAQEGRQIEEADGWPRDSGGEMGNAEHGRRPGRESEGPGAGTALSSNLGDPDRSRSQERLRLREDDDFELPTALGADRLWPARPGEPQHEWEAARTNLPFDLLSVWGRVRPHYPETLRTQEAKREAEKAFGLAVGEMDRAVDGLSGRLLRRYIARLKNRRIHALSGLGNAVVPDVVEMIGRAIMEIDSIIQENNTQ